MKLFFVVLIVLTFNVVCFSQATQDSVKFLNLEGFSGSPGIHYGTTSGDIFFTMSGPTLTFMVRVKKNISPFWCANTTSRKP